MLVLRQRLGGKQIQRPGVGIGQRRFQNRQVVAQRLAAGGAGDDDQVAPGAGQLERRDLVRVQSLDAARRQQFGQRRRQRHRRIGKLPRPLGQHGHMLQLPGVKILPPNPIQKRNNVHGCAASSCQILHKRIVRARRGADNASF